MLRLSLVSGAVSTKVAEMIASSAGSIDSSRTAAAGELSAAQHTISLSWSREPPPIGPLCGTGFGSELNGMN